MAGGAVFLLRTIRDWVIVSMGLSFTSVYYGSNDISVVTPL